MSNDETGFTIAETAVVLIIVGLLLGGTMMSFSTLMENQRVSDTKKILEQAKEALIGFAVANGRLPCPASAISNGKESPAGGGICTNPYNGFLPAVTLGMANVDSNGYALDAWGISQNRLRYAVTTSNASAFTTTNGMKTATMAALAPNLSVCASAAGITGVNCGAATPLTSTAPAVIYSVGGNSVRGGVGDEAANPNPNGGSADPVFVSHGPTSSTAPTGEFDDIVTWISVNTLFARMVATGSLP